MSNPCYNPLTCSRPNNARLLDLLDDVMDNLSRPIERHHGRSKQSINPRFDIRETKDAYELDGEIPGVDQDDIEIEFSDEHSLLIKGCLREERSFERAHDAELHGSPQKTKSDEKLGPLTSSSTEAAGTMSYQASVEDDFEDLSKEGDASSTEIRTEPPNDQSNQTAISIEDARQSSPSRPQAHASQDQRVARRWLSERGFGSFSRSFRFAERIETGAVSASLKNGVLSITAPKAAVPEPRRIVIE